MSDKGIIARTALNIGAIKVNTEKPFVWSSGYSMPIYNDNRKFLYFPRHKKIIVDSLSQLANGINFNVIAGIATGGIPYATSLADKFECPLIYIRNKPKEHGLKNLVEGVANMNEFSGKNVLLIEDLISLGENSVKAINAVREIGGIVNYCFSVFNYGFDETAREFESLNPRCEIKSVLDYKFLLKVIKEGDYLDKNQIKSLEEWKEDPFGWGKKRGFPKKD